MEHRHFLRIAAALCLLAAVAVAEEDRLGLLIGKALERESLFDGVEAGFQLENSSGRGGRGGQGGRGSFRTRRGTAGTSPGGSVPSTSEGAGQNWRRSPRRDSGGATRPSGTYVIQGHFASYAGNVSMTAESSITGEGGFQSRTMRQVTNGQITKGLVETANGSRGSVSFDTGMMRMRAPTPDRMGITGLPFASGSMVDHLSGVPAASSFNFRGNSAQIQTQRQAAYVGEEIIDGHSVLVVEVTETTQMRNRTRESVERLYFAEDLNYACVRTEQGRVRGGELRMTSRWDFGDFEEVKPGLFVPFSSDSFRLRGDAEPVKTTEYTLLSLAFPGSFDEGVFKLEFPDGTVVRDRIAAFSFTAGESPLDDEDLLFLDELPEAEVEIPAGEPVEPEAGTAAQAPPTAAEPGRDKGGSAPPAFIWCVVAAIAASGAALVLLARRVAPKAK